MFARTSVGSCTVHRTSDRKPVGALQEDSIESSAIAAARSPGSPRAEAHARSHRQPELDGLRGLLLVWMTLTHLPTRVSAYSNQMFGFVSAAEGFIFLSALLCGRVFGRKLVEEGPRFVWRRVLARCGRLYAYHLILLAIAFTVVARIAIHTKEPSLQGLLDFYLAHPLDGIVASILLVYRPPLLDILPMYILFLFGSPALLYAGRRWGWRWILIPSLIVWAAAQFGLRPAAYWAFIRITGTDIPFSALGAFDLYAWQLLWVAGLWVGTGRPELIRIAPHPKLAFWASSGIAVAFFVIRHSRAWNTLNAPPWAPLTDKWHLGAVRILNFTVVSILFATAQPAILKWLGRGPAVLMGRASLEVFCAHLLVCFAALAIVGDGSRASVAQQAGIICFALAVLYLTASIFRKKA